MQTWLYALVFLLTFAVAPQARAQAAQGPGFNCSAARDVDAAVCRDSGLSADDRRLNALYAAARTDVFGAGPSQQQALQRKWLKDTHADCAASAFARTKRYKTQRDCIADAYDARLRELAVAALFTDPDDAMAALRQAAPADAPIYEAIYLYATIDNAKARASRAAQAIAPVYAGLSNAEKTAFTDNGGPGTAEAAAASDKAFGNFVDLSASEAGHGVTWPCAVFVKRPGLLAALGAMYGSTKDNFLPYADCDEMAPAGAAGFTGLMTATLRDAPDCGGTLRFAGGREFYRLRTAALLHRPEQWTGLKIAAADKPEAAFRRRRAADIAGAQAQLAAYYVRTFHLDTAKAGRDAARITDVLISQACNLCG